MNPAELERVRAYVDGELSPESIQALHEDARHCETLRAELERQLALRRFLSSLPSPAMSMGGARGSWRSRLRAAWRSAPWLAQSTLAATALGIAWLGVTIHPRAPSANVVLPPLSDLVPVRFTFHGNASSVVVAGSFNHWSSEGVALQPVAPEVWEATVSLPHGEHRYLFKVDGQWRPDPRATRLVPDGTGNVDAVLQL